MGRFACAVRQREVTYVNAEREAVALEEDDLVGMDDLVAAAVAVTCRRLGRAAATPASSKAFNEWGRGMGVRCPRAARGHFQS